jgi:NAD(P)-dependent dehydrogenase (short-subunit alcohol dehydrogenase family)
VPPDRGKCTQQHSQRKESVPGVGDWSNKVVLVTGGSAGLGLAIGKAFARSGARVVLAARDPQRLREAVAQVEEQGGEALGIAADVTQPSDVQRLIEETVARWGRLDCVVNNAGKSMRGEVLTTPPEDFSRLFDINFLSAVRCTQAAAEHLIATRGHVVNIGSLASRITSRYLGAYPASKFPVAALSQQLRFELGPRGVHTLLVCPGPLRRPDAGHRYADQADGLPVAARQPGGGVKLRGIDPDYLAVKIVQACERRQYELVVPARARLLFVIGQLWPRLGDWIIGRMTRH